jgi:hypothetical protein
MEGILYEFIGQSGLFGKTLWGKHVPCPVLRHGGDLEVTLLGKTLDKGVDQSQGDVEFFGQLPLALGIIPFDLFKYLKRMNIVIVHFEPTTSKSGSLRYKSSWNALAVAVQAKSDLTPVHL